MKVKIYETNDGKLCWVDVTREEALCLIQSLARQLETNNPNVGRLESRCKGDVNEFTIAVK